jgi:signal peptidase II
MAVVVFLVMGVDGLTKVRAENALEVYNPVPVAGQLFQLRLGYNTGVAFGLFANGGVWPLVFTSILIVGMLVGVVLMIGNGEIPSRAEWPIALLLGGAIANFIDRFPDGRVTDFLDVGFGISRWPTFNMADTAIVLGCVITIVMMMKWERQLEDKR